MTGRKLRLFGVPSLFDPDGHPVPTISAAKDLALLAFLTLQPGPHSREEIAALLWGDSPDEQARASLRQALKRLNTLAGTGLSSTRQSLELIDPPSCDVLDFQAALVTNPAAAGEFDVPRFFSGFTLRHAPGFDEWLSSARLRFTRQYHQTLGALARDALLRWQWREAAKWAERWLASDPLVEDGWKILIEATHLAGDRANALAHMREYETRIKRELDTTPGPAVLALKNRIMADNAAELRRPVSADWLAHGPQLDTALVGRSPEWNSLMDAWRAVSRGRAQVVLIEGDAGVGKTRLAEDFLRWAESQRAVLLRGRGYDALTGTPYGPLVEALRCGLSAPGLTGTDPEWLMEATRLLPELRRRFPNLPEPAAGIDAAGRLRLFESVAQMALALAAESPVILLIDDVQWCDAETCALLHFLVRRWASAPIVLMATLTPGDLERDAPAARLCRALRVQPHARTVTLRALNEDEVFTMIHDMGHFRSPEAGRRFASRVSEVTNGSPFYIIELLKTLFAQGLLAVDPLTGMWAAGPEACLEGSRAFPMSQTVQDAIGERVGRLPTELRDLLATVTLASPTCETDLLSHVHSISRLQVATLCEELVTRRLAIEEDGVYRVAHGLIAEAVRRELTVSHRREIHRSIALALQEMAGDNTRHEMRDSEHHSLAGRIARHAEYGGEGRMACHYAIKASAAALGRYGPEEALIWLDLAAVTADGPEQSNEVNRLTAEVLEFAGWTEAPRGMRRISTSLAGLAQEDLDFD